MLYIQLTIGESQQTNLQLQDQNTLLKAQLATGTATLQPSEPSTTVTVPNPEPSPTSDSLENVKLRDRIKRLEEENAEKSSELERLHKDQEDLLELLTHQECNLTNLKERLRQLGENTEEFEDDGDSDTNPNEA